MVVLLCGVSGRFKSWSGREGPRAFRGWSTREAISAEVRVKESGKESGKEGCGGLKQGLLIRIETAEHATAIPGSPVETGVSDRLLKRVREP